MSRMSRMARTLNSEQEYEFHRFSIRSLLAIFHQKSLLTCGGFGFGQSNRPGWQLVDAAGSNPEISTMEPSASR